MKNGTTTERVTCGILFIAAFLFVFLFSCTTSPLYEHYPFWFHGDSGIFQEMGVCLLQGGTPYVDLFDHKGPMLWLIQAFGIWISPRWGLMALQSFFLFATLFMWYKSSEMLTGKRAASLIVSLLCLVFLMAFYQRGNLCEEWSLPFISLPIYIYIKRWKEVPESERPIYNHKDAMVLGLCVGALAMIRLNNTAPLVGFALWHLVRCLQQKEYKRFWTDVAIICAGMVAVFAICVAFYLSKAGWTGVYEMVYGTFVFNFMYLGGKAEMLFVERLPYYIPLCVALIATIVCTVVGRRTLNVGIPATISYTVSLLSIGGHGFLHYMMIIVPLFVISAGITIKESVRWIYAVWIGMLCFSAYTGRNAVDLLAFRLRGKHADTEINEGFHRFVTSIPAAERKSIYNAGLNHMGAGLFADENIYQCNRIIYKGHSDISAHLQEYEATHRIADIEPTWVLTQSERPEAKDGYMTEHYTLKDSIPGGEYDPIWCWKKKKIE